MAPLYKSVIGCTICRCHYNNLDKSIPLTTEYDEWEIQIMKILQLYKILFTVRQHKKKLSKYNGYLRLS